MMPSQQLTMFDPAIASRLEVAEAILREFLEWHGDGEEGDRPVTRWHRVRIEEYFQDPEGAEESMHWRRR